MRRRIKRALLVLAGLFLTAGSVAPFVQANRFGDRVKTALETSLRRKVHIGAVHLDLFTGPGFSVKKVLIEEDPAIGVEPIASVETLSARVSLASLWTGKLEFSSLTLDEPSVNLSREGDGPWNLFRVLQGAQQGDGGGKPGRSRGELPVIRVRSGRINLKLGDKKLPLYLANADVDISPLSREASSFDLRFEGEPARTDTTAQTFGKVRGQGRWLANAGKQGELHLTVELAKSNVGELTRLVRGRDYGIHGVASSRATINGPLDQLVVKGELQMGDVHRWDAMPAAHGGEWKLKYEGLVDWHAQTVSLDATPKQNPGAPVAARLRMTQILRNPQWASTFSMEEVPAGSVVEIMRHMGAGLPNDLLVGGKVFGVIAYSSVRGLYGQVNLADGVLRASERDRPVDIASAELKIDGSRIVLTPTVLQISEKQTAHVEGEFGLREPSFTFSVKGRGLDVAAVQSRSARMLSSATIPWVETLHGGVWTGAMQYVRDAEGLTHWASAFELRDAQATIPGLADPLRIRAALVEIEGAKLTIRKLKGTLRKIPIEGEYVFDPELERPHQFRIDAGKCALAEVEQVLLPTLHRKQGFIARTLNFDTSNLPDWLQSRHAEGSVRINRLSAPGFDLNEVSAKLIWQGPQVRLESVQARLDDGDLSGSLVLDVTHAQPRYRLTGRVTGMSWRSGKLDVEGKIDMTGLGAALLASMRSDGSFQARSVALLEDNPVKAVTGFYEFNVGAAGPQLTLRSVEASVAGENYSGEGGTQAGVLQLDLISASRVLHVAGPLQPLKLDVVAKVN